tara:strand:- start:304 stop:741 length:438 start_codon:yes stop_codon:yes gene_type:complete
MGMFNKAVSSISETRMEILSEWSLRLALAFLFFLHGLPKIEALISAPSEPFSYVVKMAFFGELPLISSYLVTAAELVLIPLFIFVGGLKFIGSNAKVFSTLGGLIGTFTMLIIIFVYHFGVKGEGILEVKYQLSLLAISLYFLFK